MTTDEALDLALEALEVANSLIDGYYLPKEKAWLPEIEEAITAIKQARSAPYVASQLVQSAERGEPVAWMKRMNIEGDNWDAYDFSANQYGDFQTPLYTTPPNVATPLAAPAPEERKRQSARSAWVGLTDEERKFVRNSVGYNHFFTAGEYAEHVQKATEAKLQEKNA
jgi:hypothetical protein